MIQEKLGSYNNTKTRSFKEYQFSTKPSLPYIKVKRAQNIPEVYYDNDFSSQKIVNQIATDNYNAEIRENFDNIGYIPKNSKSANIFAIQRQINTPKKQGFDFSTQTEKRSTQTNSTAKLISTQTLAKRSIHNTPYFFFPPMAKLFSKEKLKHSSSKEEPETPTKKGIFSPLIQKKTSRLPVPKKENKQLVNKLKLMRTVGVQEDMVDIKSGRPAYDRYNLNSKQNNSSQTN